MADTPLVDIENRICPGCKQSAVNESGGLVVAFGSVFLGSSSASSIAHCLIQPILFPCRLLQMRKVQQPGHRRHEPLVALRWIPHLCRVQLQLQHLPTAHPRRSNHDRRRLLSRTLLQVQSLPQQNRRARLCQDEPWHILHELS